MAIDKSRTKPWMKAVIIVVCVSFVLGVGFSFSGLLSTAGTSGGAATTGTVPPSSLTTSQTLDAITLKYTPKLKAREASLAATPNDFDLNVLQGQDYFDWALEVMQATQGQQGTEIWQAAIPYYETALKAKPGDPNVTTDYSIVVFYSGDVKRAITIAEDVATKNPDFAPVQFNLGIFYQQDNNKAKAKAALEKYLKLDPNGGNAANAKQMLTGL